MVTKMKSIDLNILNDENFCLKMELDALADILLRNESERMIPKFSIGVIENDHQERYKLAAKYVEDKKVLDIACGAGYGSFFLASEGKVKSVVGGDVDKNAIRYASHRFKHDLASFQYVDAQNISLNEKFDVVISFETIEHLPNYKAFLENINPVLADDGIFIVSTPISNEDVNNHPSNPFHIREWGFQSFQNVISKYFIVEDIFIQLYQNAFLNDKILEEYLLKRSNMKFFSKVKSYLKRRLFDIYDLPQQLTEWTTKDNYSKIENFKAQYNIDDLGKKYRGYQILICKKKN